MTSIDSAEIDSRLIERSTARAAATHRRSIPRQIAGKIGLVLLTGAFLAATAAAIPVTAVYSFVWMAKF